MGAHFEGALPKSVKHDTGYQPCSCLCSHYVRHSFASRGQFTTHLVALLDERYAVLKVPAVVLALCGALFLTQPRGHVVHLADKVVVAAGVRELRSTTLALLL